MGSFRWLVSVALMLLIATTGCRVVPEPGAGPGGAGQAGVGAGLGAPPNPDGRELRPQLEHDLRYPSPRAGSAYDDPSMGVSLIASTVPGAGPVHAVVLGNVALLSLPSRDPAVHHQVAEQIRSSFAHVVEVRVTQDPAAGNRLAEVANHLMTNRSIAPFLPELVTLAGRMAVVE